MITPQASFALIVLVLLGYFSIKILIPPLNFPRNIPTIPFYVIFLPTILKIDQVELFELYLKEPLEKYGAVKIFFGSRWNILVSRPEFLVQVFRNDSPFAKSGNQKKIPYSVIAAYTGDNIISAHGVVWKTYRGVMTPGLQHFDKMPLQKNAVLFCNLVAKMVVNNGGKRNAISVGPLLQRLALDNVSQVLLGFDFGTLTQEKVPLHDHLLQIKRQIFSPFFLTFPFFDRLYLPTRMKAFKDVGNFRRLLVEKVQERLVDTNQFESTKFVSSDLIRAHNDKILDYKQLTDNIVILLVAGHENPQLLLTTLFYLLALYPETWQKQIWEETRQISDIKQLDELPLLNSFIFEGVRFYPPLNIIVNRKTTRTCRIGRDIVIPKGAYVGYINYATSHSKRSWGESADAFDPRRWGDDIGSIMKKWKLSKASCTTASFHGGNRACLGEKLALIEMRVTLAEVLKRFKLRLPRNKPIKMTPAGPLCPFNLELEFIEREKVQ